MTKDERYKAWEEAAISADEAENEAGIAEGDAKRLRERASMAWVEAEHLRREYERATA